MSKNQSQALKLETLYDQRFIEDYLGNKMSTDFVTAIVELIANAWDAGAKNVKIEWPSENNKCFSITDDGHGLTEADFSTRWTQLSYNRHRGQGDAVEIPEDNDISNKRVAYGRNGKGRFSAFCFADGEYYVETKREEEHHCFEVKISSGQQPFRYSSQVIPSPSYLFHSNHGTSVFAKKLKHVGMPEDRIRSEIGLRFLTDPDFKVEINRKKVQFGDIDAEKVNILEFIYQEKKVTIRAIQTEKSDKTTQQHGVAWHSNNRLVGKCCWDGLRNDNFLDGRTSYAKKYTFIVDASLLSDYIEPDWSGFKKREEVLEFYDLAKGSISDYLAELTKEARKGTTKRLKENNRQNLSKSDLIGVKRWSEFVEQVQLECPKLTDQELDSVASILANLEASTSKYALIDKLKDYTPQDLDDLNSVLDDWNIQSAKAVLDEIKYRLTLIASVREKIHKKDTLEVQELQPLFEKSLWIFGPEFESIEYTSNEGMTKVLKKLFKTEETGSLNRPDFVILPDGSVGAYGCYDFDEEGYEIGIKKVVIVELKKPGVPLGDDEKGQCWKYVKELFDKGAILSDAKVDCYLLGETIAKLEGRERNELDGAVRIRPLIYDTVLKRAESRLLNLHKKIENAPFLDHSEIQKFLEENTVQSNEQIKMI
ncbi:MAG: ATP-binding protein [Alphaproteobacteria bacterium]|nr:ATP-binding protein [Alphaproteobacteria bacterium]